MLEKTMKQVITKKINDWLSSIEDPKIVKIIKKHLIITGGCFTSMILNETPKDFDCYLRTKEAVMEVAQYYINLWNESHGELITSRGDKAHVMLLDFDDPSQDILDFYKVEKITDSQAVMVNNYEPGRVKIIFPSTGVVGDPEAVRSSDDLGIASEACENVTEVDETEAKQVEEQEKRKYFPVFMSSNAITLSNGIQLIVRFYGEPSQIHDTYDFVHTKAYWDNLSETINIPKEVYETVINKTLIYTGSKYPVCSVFRVRKFVKRGWNINAGQLLKMCMQISEINLNDISVLEDQLIGVDSIYFMNLIRQFRAQQEKNPDFQITVPYIISIIDKIF